MSKYEIPEEYRGMTYNEFIEKHREHTQEAVKQIRAGMDRSGVFRCDGQALIELLEDHCEMSIELFKLDVVAEEGSYEVD